MYFNLWGNENYTLNFFLLIIFIFISTFLISKILVSFTKKIIKKYKESKKYIEIIKKLNRIDLEKERFDYLIKKLNLNSTYKIGQFIGKTNTEVKKLISNDKYSILTNLIIKKIEGK